MRRMYSYMASILIILVVTQSTSAVSSNDPVADLTSADSNANPEPNPNCIRVGFAPDSILNDGVSSTALEVIVEPACKDQLSTVTAVATSPNFLVGGRSTLDASTGNIVPFTVLLKDDGTGEDKIAGDSVYTSPKVAYNPSVQEQATPYREVEGVYLKSPFHSNKLVLTKGDGSISSFRSSALMILDKGQSLSPIKQSSSGIQATEHVINLRDDLGVIGGKIREQGSDLTKTATLTGNLYANFGNDNDKFDILTMSSVKKTYKKDNINNINGSAGLSIITRQPATGIAAPDAAASYQGTDRDTILGSKGNLKSVTYVNEPVNLDQTFHEWLHLAGAHFDPSLGLNNLEGHWENNMSQGGILYGNRMVDNADGTMTTLGRQHTVSPLEKYLSGWIWPNELPDIKVALDKSQRFSTPGTIIHGPFRTITAQDIINTYGYRIPDPSTSLKDLKVGYVFTTDSRMATPVEMTVKEKIIQSIPPLWNKAAEGHSSVEFIGMPTYAANGVRITDPAVGSQLNSLEFRLRFQAPAETTWLHVQLVPAKSDGPGLNMLVGDPKVIADGGITIPAPDIEGGSFTALPDMGYTWRVRASSASQAPDTNGDSGWSPWASVAFRTPKTSSETIHLENLASGEASNSLTPTLRWLNANRSIFYYEVQLSSDPDFKTEPDKATAAVYWSLIHGGITSPKNSYTIPASYPLEPNTTYYWRVRPRVQGDGVPITWTAPGRFTSPAQ